MAKWISYLYIIAATNLNLSLTLSLVSNTLSWPTHKCRTEYGRMLCIYNQGTTMVLRFPLIYETNRSIISRGTRPHTKDYNVFICLFIPFIYLIYFNPSYYLLIKKKILGEIATVHTWQISDRLNYVHTKKYQKRTWLLFNLNIWETNRSRNNAKSILIL